MNVQKWSLLSIEAKQECLNGLRQIMVKRGKRHTRNELLRYWPIDLVNLILDSIGKVKRER